MGRPKKIKETIIKKGPWTKEEDALLLDMINNKGKKTYLTIYKEFSEKSNRPIKNISQHHYLISKNNSDKNKSIKEKKNIKTSENIKNISDDIKHLPEEIANAINVLINFVTSQTKI